MINEKDYSLKQLQGMAQSQGVSAAGTKENIIRRLKKHSSPHSIPATKKVATYDIDMDRMGCITITRSDDPNKDVFLQFEADKDLIYGLLRKGEQKDLDNGWTVTIKDTEPRASTLSELWEAAAQPLSQTKLSQTKPYSGEDAEAYLKRLDAEVKALWNKACDYDKINRDSKFVNFSKGNPYAQSYNKAMGEAMKWRRIIAAGGGLQHRAKPPQFLSETIPPDRGRITGIKKGKEYWPKVNATQKAILDKMNAGTILEVHSDGDLTFEAEGKQYVLTTTGELFVGKPGYKPDRPGRMPRTIPTGDDDGLKYYKVPPSAF